MSRRGSGLAGRLLALAKKHNGQFVTIPEATKAIFNGHGDEAARTRVYAAVFSLKRTGRLRGGRGGFAWPVVLVAKDEDAELAAVTPQPAGRLAVRHQLVRLAHLRNEFDVLFDEVLSECHKANSSADASREDPERAMGFPMRAASPWERES